MTRPAVPLNSQARNREGGWPRHAHSGRLQGDAGFWGIPNPFKAIVNVIKKVVEVVKKVVNEIVKVVKSIAQIAKDVIAAVAKVAAAVMKALANGIAKIARVLGKALKAVWDTVVDVLGLGKDGWLTNFLQDYIPGVGLITAAVHAMAGNIFHAQYAALKGAASAAGAILKAAIGVLLPGPLGAILGGLVDSAVDNAIQQAGRSSLDASVMGKIPKLTPLEMTGMILLGGAMGGAGHKLKGLAGGASKAGGGGSKIGNLLKPLKNSRLGRAIAERQAKKVAQKEAASGIIGKVLVERSYENPVKFLIGGLREIPPAPFAKSRNSRWTPPQPQPKPPATGVEGPVETAVDDVVPPKPREKVGAGVGVLILVFVLVGIGGVALTKCNQTTTPADEVALPPRVVVPGLPAVGETDGQTPQNPGGQTQTNPGNPGGQTQTNPGNPGGQTPGNQTPGNQTPPTIEVYDWDLRLLDGAPPGADNQSILVRFGLGTTVVTGTVYDPYLDDDLTTSGAFEPDGLIGLQTDTTTNGVMYFAGNVSSGLDYISGLYSLSYSENGNDYYYDGSFTMTRKNRVA